MADNIFKEGGSVYKGMVLPRRREQAGDLKMIIEQMFLLCKPGSKEAGAGS